MNTRSEISKTIRKQMPDMTGITKFENPNCYAVILAAGGGLPRQTYAPKSLLGRRPPQFLRKSDEDFLINKTRARVEAGFPSSATFLTVAESHARFYEDVLDDVPSRNLIVLPQDDVTTIEILHAATRFVRVDPSAVLAFFPMDFSTSDDQKFFEQVQTACLTVSSKPQLILMGIEPETSDTNFNWIEIDQEQSIDAGFKLWKILNFWHNPSSQEDEIFSGNFLLNGTVVIGTASTLIRKIRRAAPKVYAKFVENQSRNGIELGEVAI